MKKEIYDQFEEAKSKKRQKQVKTSGMISFYDIDDLKEPIKIKNDGYKKSKKFV